MPTPLVLPGAVAQPASGGAPARAAPAAAAPADCHSSSSRPTVAVPASADSNSTAANGKRPRLPSSKVSVQAGSFLMKENADDLVTELSKRGFAPVVLHETTQGKDRYRVLAAAGSGDRGRQEPAQEAVRGGVRGIHRRRQVTVVLLLLQILHLLQDQVVPIGFFEAVHRELDGRKAERPRRRRRVTLLLVVQQPGADLVRLLVPGAEPGREDRSAREGEKDVGALLSVGRCPSR